MARKNREISKVMRPGKTLRDRRSGATERRLRNRDARISWQHDHRADNKNFPVEACNGKRNRYVKS